jgi:predicted nucleotidyltransferase
MDYRNTSWYREFGGKCILMGYRGSQAHGTYRPNTEKDSIDDIDLMGIMVHPISAYLGFGCQETYERAEDPWDIVIYDLRHFIKLLVKSNPNVLSMLWLPPNMYTELTPAGQALIDNRSMFATKAAHDAFIGYGYSQIKRMKKMSTEGYMGQKRKQLVEKWGYDCKAAAHALRILKMGVEFMSTGELRVQREDNTWLVDVKTGKYSLEYCQAEADRLLKLSDEAMVRSPLPPRVDAGKAEKLLIEILSNHFGIVGKS